LSQIQLFLHHKIFSHLINSNFIRIHPQGHLLDEHHGIGIQNNQVYSTTGPLRTTSNSNSPGNLHGQQSSTLLVVPQPINATKISTGISNNTGRKYQCKMCPQVSMTCLRYIIYGCTGMYLS